MQPNEQGQNQQLSAPPTQNQAQPLPYAVPEYLHLDPVTGQAKRSFKKPVLITLVVLVVVGVIGFVGYQVWQYNQPQTRFYRALENSLKVNFIERQYVVVDKRFGYNVKLQADAKTDFTKPALPKSSVSYEYNGDKTSYKTDYVMPGGKQYMALTHSVQADLVADQWYEMTFNTVGTDTINYVIDKGPIKEMFNTEQGLLPTGNFTASQRSNLMTYIRAHKVYTVAKSETNRDATMYTITFDVDALNSMNKEVANILGIKQVYTGSISLSDPSKFIVAVDNKSERLKQTDYTVSNESRSLFQETVSYSYPANLSIITPGKTLKLREGVNI